MAGEPGGGHGATTAVWIATALMMIGVVVGGIALIEWVWPVFWVGVGLMVVGAGAGYFSHIMDMVSEYAPAPGHEIEAG
jgi:dipeptide/tripeptide permease